MVAVSSTRSAGHLDCQIKKASTGEWVRVTQDAEQSQVNPPANHRLSIIHADAKHC